MNTLHNWIIVLACAYMEYTEFRGKQIYRRTVSYDSICWC